MNPNGGACQCSTKPWGIGVSRLELLHYALRAIRTALAASEYFILSVSERAAQSASPRALTQACR
jgi:hypothetical protein